ncbi:MAG: DUF3788 family protein [Planctomycetota bacterium]|jgi:hypothetical protein
MAASIFEDKSVRPDSEKLLCVLGKSAGLWEKVRDNLQEDYGELVEDWKHYGQKTGWLLKVLRKKRNLFFHIPMKGAFQITFTFGEKAVSAVKNSDLPAAIKAELRDARRYAEGRVIRIDVKSAKDVANIRKLVKIKVHN